MSNFSGHYDDWRSKRITKIENIFGKQFFKEKTILELACGYGDIGKHFCENLKSTVTFAEGREEHLKNIREKNPDSEIVLLNQENEWNLNKKFDVVIHFGVLYHLDNWRQDLKCTMNHSDIIILESEIADTFNEDAEYKYQDPVGLDQALSESRTATRPSAQLVEKEIVKNGGTFTRYDDSELNSGMHIYDWIVSGEADKVSTYNRDTGIGKRRFWVIRKNRI